MLNILFVNDNLRLPAGITMFMKNIIDNCPSKDIKFSILTIESERNNATEYFKNKGVTIYYMPGMTTTSSDSKIMKLLAMVNFVSLFSMRRFFAKFFSCYSFDIIHSHFSQIDNLMFKEAKKRGVKCCISHSHSSQLSDSKLRALRNKIMCYGLHKRADYCAACSDNAGRALFGASFINSSRRMIIKNGINTTEFLFNLQKRSTIRQRYNIPDNSIVIGHVGRLNKVKNQTYLIDILSELQNEKLRYVLLLVGSGECEKELKLKAERDGLLDNIIFAGAQNDISSYLCAFDIFVMPSIHEGLGIAAVEAQANGLECIVSSSVPHEVDLTGLTFMDISASPALWADQIRRMPKRHHIEYNQAVKNIGYDINSVCKDLCKFYREVSCTM